MSRFLQKQAPLASHEPLTDPVRLQLHSKNTVDQWVYLLRFSLPLQTPLVFDSLKNPSSQVSHLSPTYPVLQTHLPVLPQVVFSFVPIAKHLHSKNREKLKQFESYSFRLPLQSGKPKKDS